MQEDKILTLHTQGKHGANILKRKYTILKNFILKTIRQQKEITFEELSDLAEDELPDSFDGKVLWYLVTVKLDLEARGLIEPIPKQVHIS